MVERSRPNATVKWTDGNDGRDGCYYIAYECPKCGSGIYGGYKSRDVCFNCGTIFDWGKEEPHIVVTRTTSWD